MARPDDAAPRRFLGPAAAGIAVALLLLAPPAAAGPLDGLIDGIGDLDVGDGEGCYARQGVGSLDQVTWQSTLYGPDPIEPGAGYEGEIGFIIRPTATPSGDCYVSSMEVEFSLSNVGVTLPTLEAGSANGAIYVYRAGDSYRCESNFEYRGMYYSGTYGNCAWFDMAALWDALDGTPAHLDGAFEVRGKTLGLLSAIGRGNIEHVRETTPDDGADSQTRSL